jgi:hypothetical protein
LFAKKRPVLLTVAGIVSIHFTLEKNGKVIFEQKLERVVTDGDPQYTGPLISSSEDAIMFQVIQDSLREIINDLMKKIHKTVS